MSHLILEILGLEALHIHGPLHSPASTVAYMPWMSSLNIRYSFLYLVAGECYRLVISVMKSEMLLTKAV